MGVRRALTLIADATYRIKQTAAHIFTDDQIIVEQTKLLIV
jgi:hypothetical protein